MYMCVCVGYNNSNDLLAHRRQCTLWCPPRPPREVSRGSSWTFLNRLYKGSLPVVMVFYALFAAGFDWPAAAALFLFPHLFHSSLWAPGNFVVRNLSLLITLNPPAPKAQVCNCPFLFPCRRRGVAARMGFGRLCFASTTDRLVLGPRRRLSSAPGTACGPL